MSQATELIATQVGSAINNQKTWGTIIYNVKDPQYGAKGDGVADDTLAIQKALNASSTGSLGPVVFPAGTYRVSGLVNNSRIAMIGTDPQNTKIIGVDATTPIITYNNDLSFVYLANLTLDREVTATSGGDGIKSTTSGMGFLFNNLQIKNQYKGINLTGTIAGAYITNCFVTDCVNDGIRVSFPNMKFSNIYSMRNGGNGYSFDRSSAGLYMTNCEAYKNIGHGIVITASVGGTESFNDVFILQCISGSNAKQGIYLDTNGQNAIVSNCFVEYSGWYDEGVNIAPGTQAGIIVTTRNNRVDLVNNIVMWSSGVGLQIQANGTKVNGGIYAVNSLQSYGASSGIAVLDNVKRVMIRGVSSCKYVGDGAATQSFGIAIYPGVDEYLVTDCDLKDNISGAFYIDAGALKGKIQNCRGFNPRGNITAPVIPASGTALTSNYPFAVNVHVHGGTVTGIAKNGLTITSMTFGMVRLEPGETITLTYSVAPSWTWFGE